MRWTFMTLTNLTNCRSIHTYAFLTLKRKRYVDFMFHVDSCGILVNPFYPFWELKKGCSVVLVRGNVLCPKPHGTWFTILHKRSSSYAAQINSCGVKWILLIKHDTHRGGQDSLEDLFSKTTDRQTDTPLHRINQWKSNEKQTTSTNYVISHQRWHQTPTMCHLKRGIISKTTNKFANFPFL